MNPRWTLRRRVVALCALMAAVLALLSGGAAVAALANRDQLDTLLNNLTPMTVAAGELLQAVLDEDASVRAYTISAAEADLAAYKRAVAAEQRRATDIRTNRAATADIAKQLALVDTLTAAWRRTIAEPAISAVRRRGARAGQNVFNANPRGLDPVRSAIDVLQTTMVRERDGAAASVRDTNTTVLFVLIVAILLVVASGVGMLIALQQLVIGPVTGLAGQVRTVAHGNYRQAISTRGPPELESLAADVDSMRRRITTDLAEVQRVGQQIEEANRLLEQQAAELTRSNQDLEQFAYIASHDLQEPLRKVSSFCQLVQRRYAGKLDDKADQYLAYAVDGAQRGQRLIHDLLAFSRIGRGPATLTDVDLGRLVDEAAASGDAQPAVITHARLPIVRGVPDLLATLLGNLIGNSVKFRHPDRAPRVHVTATEHPDHWEVSCVDNGIGIDPDKSETVFAIFQRLHSREAYPGTGIGLAVAKRIVEHHGGRIWVDPGHRDGTAIRFTLSRRS